LQRDIVDGQVKDVFPYRRNKRFLSSKASVWARQ
jgi:isocitrate dehydrogenase kinase/phosphatase